MIPLLLLALVFTTSLGAYWLGTRWLGYSRRLFRLALGRATETIGLALVFFAVNVTIVVFIVLVLRTLGRFASLYVATDPVLLILSGLQALGFQFWRYAANVGKE